MCGIAGTIQLGDCDIVQSMTALMGYRGPDDWGLYEDGDVVLGHTRLSILDLSPAGRQPMQTGDGRLAITYNGEIYNFLQLREELERDGYRFCTHTDTETILYAYDQYGMDFLERLEGMFAFALWDRSLRQLVLARDRLGMKPLFYHVRGSGLAFTSELKPMLRVPGIEKRVSRPALRSALRYASNFEDESMLATVHKLRPGHMLVWRGGHTECHRYWTHPEARPERWDEATLVEEVRTRLRNAVQSHMISDAPLGAALSGGLDSSGVVAMMAGVAGPGVTTFTAGDGPDDPDIVKARLVAEHCRTDHHESIVSPENVADLMPRVVWHLEEPLGYPETVQMYLNYASARRHVKVLLIGEGADECFGGYSRYKLLQNGLPLPAAVKKELYGRVYMYADEAPRNLPARLFSNVFFGAVPPSPLADPHPRTPMPPLDGNRFLVERAGNYDQRTHLPNMSLKRADALGMAHSVELRVPFLDRSLVELAARIPSKYLIRRGVEKYVLRKALEPYLPESITWRRKRPFQMRLKGGRLVAALDYLCDQLLRPEDVRARGFFDPKCVESVRRTRPGRFAVPMSHNLWAWRIWSMLMCELWARMFLDRDISTAPPQSLAEALAPPAARAAALTA